jgi:hypothetical protein
MEFTRKMLKDQLHHCQIPEKTFERSFNISLVNDMIKDFVKNLWKKNLPKKVKNL